MSLASDLKILYHLALAPVRGATHRDRLESFYAGQAENYDAFRKGLLHGREEMFRRLEFPADGVWVDLGSGTGSSLEFAGDAARSLRKAYLVDLSPSLLEVASKRARSGQWPNVETVEGDVCEFQPLEGPVDVVTFSYSLTMIPDWFRAVDRAAAMLRPGGRIGVVDFFVARKHPEPDRARHSWWTRTFWPTWFGMDNVFLSPDHVPYLHRRFDRVFFEEGRGSIRYLPGLKAPYYIFVGRKAG